MTLNFSRTLSALLFVFVIEWIVGVLPCFKNFFQSEKFNKTEILISDRTDQIAFEAFRLYRISKHIQKSKLTVFSLDIFNPENYSSHWKLIYLTNSATNAKTHYDLLLSQYLFTSDLVIHGQ